MLNFTEEIKNEIMDVGFDTLNEKLAAFSAFVRTSGSVFSRGGNFGFELVTENERTADFFENILICDFGINVSSDSKTDLFKKKDKFTFVCADNKTDLLLKKLGITGEDVDGKFVNFGISDYLISDDGCAAAYIKGAFLGGGSCTLPEPGTYSTTGYHLEFVFAAVPAARDFCELLCRFEILAKLVARKDNAVVYVKSKEVVSDILNLMSADKCRRKLNRVVEQKDKANNANRVSNCAASNIDKTVTASVKQVRAIETIRQTVGLKALDENLFEVAEVRLADKNASMQELADRLHISKSCINHRMRKLIAMAEELDD